jgi:hypothetical protein
LDKDELGDHEAWRAMSSYIAMQIFMYLDQFDKALAMFKEIQSSAWYNSAPSDQIAVVNLFEKYFSNPPKLYQLVIDERPRPKIIIQELDNNNSHVMLSLVFVGRLELDYEFAKQNNINVDDLPKSIPISLENIMP